MSSRDAILGKVRKSLHAGEDASRLEAVRQRLAHPPVGVTPARTRLDAQGLVALFCEMAAKAAASVERVVNDAAVPVAVAAYLRRKNLAPAFRMGSDPRLHAMPWNNEPGLKISRGPSDGDDEVGLSHALGGIAETGTLVLFSGPENPTSLNFLPDHHIVVVDAANIGGETETVLAKARQTYGKRVAPRTINLITGPSRSGDIEQKLLLGAHGPRALHIIVAGAV